jgi:hypothetical protein
MTHDKCRKCAHNKHKLCKRCRKLNAIQSGTFEVSSVSPLLPPNINVTDITFSLFSGMGMVGATSVTGPIQIETSNSYIYTLNIPVTFSIPFKNHPSVFFSLESASGSIYAPTIGVVNNVIGVVDNVTTTGFTLRIHVTIQDFTQGQPAGANIIFRQLLQPNSKTPIRFNYLAK